MAGVIGAYRKEKKSHKIKFWIDERKFLILLDNDFIIPKLYDHISYVEYKRRGSAECPGCSSPYNESTGQNRTKYLYGKIKK